MVKVKTQIEPGPITFGILLHLGLWKHSYNYFLLLLVFAPPGPLELE